MLLSTSLPVLAHAHLRREVKLRLDRNTAGVVVFYQCLIPCVHSVGSHLAAALAPRLPCDRECPMTTVRGGEGGEGDSSS
eukprot:761813-Hanusia_phi.AAC.6